MDGPQIWEPLIGPEPGSSRSPNNLASTSGNCYQWGRKIRSGSAGLYSGKSSYDRIVVRSAYTIPRWTELLKHGAEHQIIGNTKATVAIDINTALGTGCRRMHSTWAGPTPTSGFTRMKIT